MHTYIHSHLTLSELNANITLGVYYLFDFQRRRPRHIIIYHRMPSRTVRKCIINNLYVLRRTDEGFGFELPTKGINNTTTQLRLAGSVEAMCTYIHICEKSTYISYTTLQFASSTNNYICSAGITNIIN